MFCQSIARSLLVPIVGIALMAGCDGGGGMTTAPVGHDGKSATGHAGAGPAGGPNSPQAKAEAAKKAAAPK